MDDRRQAGRRPGKAYVHAARDLLQRRQIQRVDVRVPDRQGRQGRQLRAMHIDGEALQWCVRMADVHSTALIGQGKRGTWRQTRGNPTFGR
jgi:hypothetical protein